VYGRERRGERGAVSSTDAEKERPRSGGRAMTSARSLVRLTRVPGPDSPETQPTAFAPCPLASRVPQTSTPASASAH
jgi:hypothetical protein